MILDVVLGYMLSNASFRILESLPIARATEMTLLSRRFISLPFI